MGVGRRAATWAFWVAALGLTGCGSGGGSASPAAIAKPWKGARISAAVVGEPGLIDVLNAQSGEWRGSRGAEVAVGPGPVAPSDARTADVILFTADRLGDLADVGALAVLPESVVRPPPARAPAGSESAPPGEGAKDPLDFDDIEAAFRDEVTRYGLEQRLALPLGGSALVLAYRRDAFEREANRSAAKEAGLALEPPKTWDDLDRLAKFLHGRDWDGDDRPDAGLALAWGIDAEGVGNAALLNRAAALGQRADQYSFLFDADTMAPRIDSPPFVEALGALMGLASSGPEGASGFDAVAARAAFRSGQAALLIDRAERVADWVDPKRPAAVAVAALPGSARVYDPARKTWETASPPNRPTYLPGGGGWLAGLSPAASGLKKDAALNLLLYLVGPETQARIITDRSPPTLPVRSSQLALGAPDPRSAPGLDASSWTRAVGQTYAAPRVLPGLRIPRTDEYLKELDRARADAMKGRPAEEALGEAAKAWSRLTESLGVARQLWHYRRSLNKYPTTAEPPAVAKRSS